MPLTITKLKMWKNPGYTRGCVEVPPAGSKKLPSTPDYSLPSGKTLRPHKDSILTSLRVPLSYSQLFDMSYLYIEASDGAGTIKLFGWIDAITMIASSNENILIDWSVDWWRSYSGSATFGAGIVARCNDATYKRPRSLQPRLRLVNSTTRLFGSRPNTEPLGMWTVVVIELTTTYQTTTVYTTIEKLAWPSYSSVNVGPNGKVSMSLISCYEGRIDEMLTKWMASMEDANYKYNYDVIAAYATPIKPDTGIKWSGTAWIKDGLLSPDVVEVGTFAFFRDVLHYPTSTNYYQYTPGSAITTDDEHQYVITDFDGNIAATIPWGTKISCINAFNDIGVAGGYIKLAIWDTVRSDINTRLGCEGRLVSIPLPTIPITANYWSDYILSGQREFNIENRKIAHDEEAWKSGISEGKSFFDNLFSNPLNAISGAISGPAAIAGNYMVNEHFGDKITAIEDMTSSRQKNTLQLSGMSLFWIELRTENANVAGPYLVDMKMDTVSAAEYTAEISTMGYETQIPAASCSAFVTAGGPLKINQLVVTGSIPPQAKSAIKALLDNGVRIVENNPSGVAP